MHATKLVLASLLPLIAGAAEPPATDTNRAPGLAEGTRVFRDLEYVTKGHARQKLDVYLPAHGTNWPLIVWIHGGAWLEGSKEKPPALRFLRDDYAVASVNYRLSQHAIFPAPIQDCKAAIRWLRANAIQFGYNANQIGVWGASAGGHLVALLGTSGGVKEFDTVGPHSNASSRVQCVVDFFGPSDLTAMAKQAPPDSRLDHDAPSSPESRLVGGPIQARKELARTANPIRYVTSDDPPFLILHGDKDNIVPIGQSEWLHTALKNVGVDATFFVVQGAGHGFGNRAEVGPMVSEFFTKHLKATPSQGDNTALGVARAQFTVNNRPAFLLGFSYYGALGAPKDFVRQDLRELHAHGFNWLRVWATWGAYETNVSAVTAAGLPREPFLTRLKSLVAECDRLGMVVDVTLSRGKELTGLKGHLAAVDTLATVLKPFRNWYLDLGNERDVRDARYVSLDELKQLREKARRLDPERLVTASFGGHDLSLADVRGALEVAGVDFLCPHRPRHRGSPGETETETRQTSGFTKEVGRIVPVHYQEPFRRGYTAWKPRAADFLTDLRGALKGGAAGWCFHNGGQRAKPDEQPRRSFDLRAKRLLEQLDEEEMKVVRSVKSVLLDHPK